MKSVQIFEICLNNTGIIRSKQRRSPGGRLTCNVEASRLILHLVLCPLSHGRHVMEKRAIEKGRIRSFEVVIKYADSFSEKSLAMVSRTDFCGALITIF